MNTYKLIKNTGGSVDTVMRVDDNACIPFAPSNTDYQRFKQDIANGSELQDAEGNVMTAEQAQAFVQELP